MFDEEVNGYFLSSQSLPNSIPMCRRRDYSLLCVFTKKNCFIVLWSASGAF